MFWATDPFHRESLTSLSAPFSAHATPNRRSNEQLLLEAVCSGGSGSGSGLDRNAAAQTAITTAMTILAPHPTIATTGVLITWPITLPKTCAQKETFGFPQQPSAWHRSHIPISATLDRQPSWLSLLSDRIST